MDGLAHLRWHWGIDSGWKMHCMGSAAQMCLRRGSTARDEFDVGKRRGEANTTEGLEYWSSQLNSRMFVSSRVIAGGGTRGVGVEGTEGRGCCRGGAVAVLLRGRWRPENAGGGEQRMRATATGGFGRSWLPRPRRWGSCWGAAGGLRPDRGPEGWGWRGPREEDAVVVALWLCCCAGSGDRRMREAVASAAEAVGKLLVVMQGDCSWTTSRMAGEMLRAVRMEHEKKGMDAAYDSRTIHVMSY
jgi:hypothetical protein